MSKRKATLASNQTLPRVANVQTPELRAELEVLKAEVNERMAELYRVACNVENAAETGERVLSQRDREILSLIKYGVVNTKKPDKEATLGKVQTWVVAAGLRELKRVLHPPPVGQAMAADESEIVIDVVVAEINRRHVEIERRHAEQHDRQMASLRSQLDAMSTAQAAMTAAADKAMARVLEVNQVGLAQAMANFSPPEAVVRSLAELNEASQRAAGMVAPLRPLGDQSVEPKKTDR